MTRRARALVAALLALALAAAPGAARADETPDAAPDAASTPTKRVTRLEGGVTRYDLGRHGDFLYERPNWYDWIVRPIPDMWHYTRDTFRRENTGAILAMVAVTGALVVVDQVFVDEVQNWGDDVGIEPNTDNTKTVLDAGRYQLRLPSDLGSAIYFLGDGWTHLSVGASILFTGLATDDTRAVQTGSQVFEAVLASGGITQILKHLTGHESPTSSTMPRGRWHLLPDQRAYFKHVSGFDAFPSGHLATAMATVTVVADNYPEKRYIRPLGYSLMSALALQMMNNGVHWASDYPLALAIGWSIGKMVVAQGRTPTPDKTARRDDGGWSPTVLTDSDGTWLVGMQYGF